MATNPCVAGMPVTPPLPPLTLRQILLVHLIVFQEAVFGYHVCGYEIFRWLDIICDTFYLESYSIAFLSWSGDFIPRLPDMSRIKTSYIYRAYIMRMRCDTFCAIMQPFVEQHLESKLLRRTTGFALWVTDRSFTELLGLSNATEWRRFRAIPYILLVSDLRGFHNPPGHSVLLINDGHGEEYIFDGTIDQYGWNWVTHWLMTKDELVESHMDLSQAPYLEEYFGGDQIIRAEALSMNNEYGYWAVASRRMEQIFEQVDWHSLRGCAEDEIEAQIRTLSRANFAGAYEEAVAQ